MEKIEKTGIEQINLPMLIGSILTLIGFAIIFLNPISSLTATYLDYALLGNAIMTAGFLGLLLSLQG